MAVAVLFLLLGMLGAELVLLGIREAAAGAVAADVACAITLARLRAPRGAPSSPPPAPPPPAVAPRRRALAAR